MEGCPHCGTKYPGPGSLCSLCGEPLRPAAPVPPGGGPGTPEDERSAPPGDITEGGAAGPRDTALAAQADPSLNVVTQDGPQPDASKAEVTFLGCTGVGCSLLLAPEVLLFFAWSWCEFTGQGVGGAVGPLLGIVLLACGFLFLLLAIAIGLAPSQMAASRRRWKCPYCRSPVTYEQLTATVESAFTCASCQNRIILRNGRLLTVAEAGESRRPTGV